MRREKGSVLAITTSFVLAFTMLGFGEIYFAGLQSESVQRQAASTQAFWLSEAGVQRAIWELNFGNVQGWSINAQGNRFVSENLTQASGQFLGNYNVTVSGFNTSMPKIESRGRISTAPVFTEKRINVTMFDNLFLDYALFGNSTVDIKGSLTTDSYNSSLGVYNTTTNIGDNGNVGTNGDIVPSGNSTSYYINGSASTGPSGTFSVNSTQVTNQPITHTNNETLSAIAVPEQLLGLPSGGTMSQGALNAGNYNFTDIDLTGHDILAITGPANIYLPGNPSSVDVSSTNAVIRISNSGAGTIKIYANGDIKLGGGGVINEAGIPENFLLYGTGGAGQQILVSGTNSFYGVIYAPNADITLKGNFTAFGAIIGKSITTDGGVYVHHDDALSLQPGELRYTVQNWREVD